MKPFLCAIEPSMEFETDYAIRLLFPNPAFAQIYFETVANALDAEATEITIHISSDGAIAPTHLEITVSDNGLGFTDERFARFSRVETPRDPHHKGFGRLIYLRYFSNVTVESVFDSTKRRFSFSQSFKGDSERSNAGASDTQGSVLCFNSFARARLNAYDDLKPAIIKEKLIEQFLPYFEYRKRQKKDFKIVIELKIIGSNTGNLYPDSQTITSDDIPEFQSKPIQDNTIHAFDDISMRYWIEKDSAWRLQLTAISIDRRTIRLNLLAQDAVPPQCSVIFLFESKLFGSPDTSRQRLVLPEGITEESLFSVLRREISAVLNENFEEIQEKNNESRQHFEERYPHLAGYFDENTVGIINRDEALWFAQKRFFHEQKQILECTTLDNAAFEKSLELSSRSLTMYVLYREFIIQKLREISEEDIEYTIHNLIVPRFDEYHRDDLLDSIYRNNAWVLDDKFMSFRTILSEYKMERLIKEISTTEEAVEADGRPDISMVFSGDPDSNEKVEVVVIELKRQTDDLKENGNVQFQLIERARKLTDHCPNIGRVWYFESFRLTPVWPAF